MAPVDEKETENCPAFSKLKPPTCYFLFLSSCQVKLGHEKYKNLCLDCQVVVTGWKQKSSQCLAHVSFAVLICWLFRIQANLGLTI